MFQLGIRIKIGSNSILGSNIKLNILFAAYKQWVENTNSGIVIDTSRTKNLLKLISEGY